MREIRPDFLLRVQAILRERPSASREYLVNAWGLQPFGSDYDAWVRAVDEALKPQPEQGRLAL